MEELDFSDKTSIPTVARITITERHIPTCLPDTPVRRRKVRFSDIEDRLEDLRLQREISEVYD